MPTVIKAAERERGIHHVAYNFDDMAQQAGQYLDQVRSEAAKLIAQAQQEVDGIRTRAEQDGRQAAMLEMERLVEKQVAKQMQEVLPAFRQAIVEIQQARQECLAQWEKRLVRLASAMAARIIRRELRAAPEITLDLIQEALGLAAASPRIRLLLNPADHAALGSQVQSLVRECSRRTPTEVISASNIEPGGCRVETEFGTIDQQIESQLARLEEELT